MNNLYNQDTLKQACRLKVWEQLWICEKKNLCQIIMRAHRGINERPKIYKYAGNSRK